MAPDTPVAVQEQLYTAADLSGCAHAADPCDVFCEFWVNYGPAGLREWFQATRRVRKIYSGRVWAQFRDQNRGFGIGW